MPVGDPQKAMESLLKCEQAIRRGEQIKLRELKLEDYWADIVRLLKIHRYAKLRDTKAIARIKEKMASTVYNAYIQKSKKY